MSIVLTLLLIGLLLAAGHWLAVQLLLMPYWYVKHFIIDRHKHPVVTKVAHTLVLGSLLFFLLGGLMGWYMQQP